MRRQHRLLRQLTVAVAVLATLVVTAAPASAATSLRWSTPRLADAYASGTGDVSCPTATFCMAVDGPSSWRTWNGTTWSPWHRSAGAGPSGRVTCTSATFCLATPDGAPYLETTAPLWRWNGSAWLRAPDLPNIAFPDDIVADFTCGSPTLCVLVSDGSAGFTFSTADYVRHPLPGVDLDGVDDAWCVGSSFCMAVGTSHYWTFDGSAWSAAKALPATLSAYTRVTCGAATNCLLEDSAGALLRWDGSTWTTFDLPDATGGLSCAGPSYCVTVNRTATHVFDGTGWSSGPAPFTTTRSDGDVGHLTCASPTFCLTGSRSGLYTIYDGTTWSAPLPLGRGSQGIEQISCPTTTFCGAIDRDGPVTVGRYGSYVWPQPTRAGTQVFPGYGDVSCATSTFCMIVAGSGWSRFTGTAWTDPVSFSGGGSWQRVSCPTATFCAALSATGLASIWNGTSWGAPKKVISYGGAGLSCPSASYCLASNTNHATVAYSNGTWQPYEHLPGQLHVQSLSCVSALFCVGTTGTNGVVVRRNSVWSAPTTVGSSRLWEVDCVTSTFCGIIDISNNVYQFDGHTWARTSTGIPRDGQAGHDISCPTIHQCFAADTQYVSVGTR